MATEQSVLEHLRLLPPARRQEVMDFIEFLLNRTAAEGPPRSPRGLCADLAVDISTEEIDEARRELWGHFPREVVD